MLGTGVSETPFETRTNIVIKSGVNYVIFDNQYQPKGIYFFKNFFINILKLIL